MKLLEFQFAFRRFSEILEEEKTMKHGMWTKIMENLSKINKIALEYQVTPIRFKIGVGVRVKATNKFLFTFLSKPKKKREN